MTPSERLDATFAALADPTRRAILARLAERRGIGCRTRRALRDEPAGDLQTPQGARARRADLHRTDPPSAARARSKAAPLGEANAWLEEYRQFWERRYSALDVAALPLTADQGGGLDPAQQTLVNPVRSGRKTAGKQGGQCRGGF